MTSRPLRIVFAGGGSGGTVAPGIAIAERLQDQSQPVESIFVCSDRPVDRAILEPTGFNVYPITARPPSRSPVKAFQFASGWLSSRRAVRRVFKKGDHLVSLGGFVAPPVVSEARSQGLPISMLNLDVVTGRANRWIARRSDEILEAVISDLTTAGEPFGVPLRKGVLASADVSASRKKLGLEENRPTLLVTGASQGARSLNLFMKAFVHNHAHALAGWQILHLVGAGGEADEFRMLYAEANIPAQVIEFLDEMGDAWGAADLVLSRGGASSIAEIRANRVPSLIAPYPWHTDNHQAANAKELVGVGGAIIVDDEIEPSQNLGSIGLPLQSLLTKPQERERMFKALESLPQQNAAEAIAQHLCSRSADL